MPNTFVFANNVKTSLSVAASSTSTTLTLSSSANFPTIPAGAYWPLTLNDKATGQYYEIVWVSSYSGSVVTCLRGQEGTSALNWLVGDNVFSTNTAQTTAPSQGNPATPFQTDALTASGLITADGGIDIPSGEVLTTPTIAGNPSFSGGMSVPSGKLGVFNGGIDTAWMNTSTVFNVKNYGATGNGTTDDTTAIQNTINAAMASVNGVVYIPSGQYLVSLALGVNFPNNSSPAHITIIGDGQESSVIKFNPASAIYCFIFNYYNQFQGVNVEKLSITSMVSNGDAVAAIYLNQNSTTITNPANSALSTIQNVTIRGADGYGVTDYFNTGILILGVSNINVISTDITLTTASATGIYVYGASATDSIPVVLNIIGSTINLCKNGLVIGAYAQGITINSTNMVQNTYGIVVPAGQSQNSGIGISNSSFYATATALTLQSNVEGLMVVGNIFVLPTSSIGIGTASLVTIIGTIIGNTFLGTASSPSSQTGLSIDGGGPTQITGNVFLELATGILLGTNSSGTYVQGNAYNGSTTGVTNDGTGNSVGVATD